MARRAILAWGLLAVGVAVLAPGAASASADPIEGIWSFGGGQVAVQGQPDGTFTGTVVAPTKLINCTHEVGERMWTDIVAQPDGSYWGLHRWFYDTSSCQHNPIPGLTAWRILETNGSRYLRVCFSEPGIERQPQISPAGAVTESNFGCDDSNLIAPLPKGGLEHYVSVPNSSCLLRGRIRIRIHDPKYDPLSRVRVTLLSGSSRKRAKVRRRKRGYVATANLTRLPGTRPVLVKINLTTVLGRHLKKKRRYRRCLGKAHAA